MTDLRLFFSLSFQTFLIGINLLSNNVSTSLNAHKEGLLSSSKTISITLNSLLGKDIPSRK